MSESPAPSTKPPQDESDEEPPGSADHNTGRFDYYVLALSWSPQYCASSGKGNNDPQCAPGRRFGFVTHGLWPQHDKGGYPEDCPATEQLPQPLVASMLDIMPSERLVRHEWQKHGTCAGTSAKEYFTLVRKAHQSFRVPDAWKAPEQDVELERETFVAELLKANPSFNAGTKHVVLCSGRYLREVRLCMDKSTSPRACGRGVRNQCKANRIVLRAVR